MAIQSGFSTLSYVSLPEGMRKSTYGRFHDVPRISGAATTCYVRELYTGPTTFSGQKSGRIWKKLNLLSLDNTHEMSDPIDHVDEATAESFDHLRRRGFHFSTRNKYPVHRLRQRYPQHVSTSKIGKEIQSFIPHRIGVAPITEAGMGHSA